MGSFKNLLLFFLLIIFLESNPTLETLESSCAIADDISEKAQLILKAFYASDQKLMGDIRDQLSISQENDIQSYILINYFINRAEEVNKFLEFILFFYPNADIERFDKLDDQERDRIFTKLGNLFLLMLQLTGDSHLTKIKRENLHKAISLVKPLIFDFLIQYIMQKSDSPLEFKLHCAKTLKLLGRNIFDEFIVYFKGQLERLKKIQPEKSFCAERVIYELNWAISELLRSQN